jgi:hypothetical protein
MNERTELIIRKALEVLHNMPDGQCLEGVLKSSIDLLVKPNALWSEFNDAMHFAEQNHWVLGIRPKLGAVKWSITDPGRAEYLKEL